MPAKRSEVSFMAPAASTSDDFHMPDEEPDPQVGAQQGDKLIVALSLSLVSYLEEFAPSAV